MKICSLECVSFMTCKSIYSVIFAHVIHIQFKFTLNMVQIWFFKISNTLQMALNRSTTILYPWKTWKKSLKRPYCNPNTWFWHKNQCCDSLQNVYMLNGSGGGGGGVIHKRILLKFGLCTLVISGWVGLMSSMIRKSPKNETPYSVC